MRKAVLVYTVFVLFTVCLQAQSTKSAAEQAQASDVPTITGCLQLTDNSYTLTDDEGQSHDLSGGTRKLRPFVGHEVEITGKQVTRTVDNTPPGGASSVRYYSVFEVKSVKQLSDQCK